MVTAAEGEDTRFDLDVQVVATAVLPHQSTGPEPPSGMWPLL